MEVPISKKTFIVEDDPDSVNFARRILEDHGYQDKPIEPDKLIRTIRKIITEGDM